jgi:pyrimidine and pyridine-specific 5'-nucleotidase
MGSLPPQDARPVFFFDIDNCLYPKSRRVHDHMGRLINEYFVKHLSLSEQEAYDLHQRYYIDYGLAVEGLSLHHKMDPMDFNREVDDALPLDEILKPDLELRHLLESFDKSKVKMWLFTNAHVTHGLRVVKLLGIDDLFEGITFCDYRENPLMPKPRTEMYEKAEREAGVIKSSDCCFVDDSYINCVAAHKRKWTAVHLVEPDVNPPEEKASDHQIAHLSELLALFPQFIKQQSNGVAG